MNRIITIDLEGDGLDKSINQSIFPNGCHLDPNTRIWCCTVTWDKGVSKTLVCKLPSTERAVINDEGKVVGLTKAVHYDDTVIPETIWANGVKHKIVSYNDYKLFINDIWSLINVIASGEDKLYAKGYGKYNYDKLLLEIIFKKFGYEIPDWWDRVWVNAGEDRLVNVLWKETPSQIHSGTYIPNQQYMNYGIQHNIVDSEQLFDVVTKVNQIHEMEDAIKRDF